MKCTCICEGLVMDTKRLLALNLFVGTRSTDFRTKKKQYYCNCRICSYWWYSRRSGRLFHRWPSWSRCRCLWRGCNTWWNNLWSYQREKEFYLFAENVTVSGCTCCIATIVNPIKSVCTIQRIYMHILHSYSDILHISTT